jgi:hypothetical protein
MAQPRSAKRWVHTQETAIYNALAAKNLEFSLSNFPCAWPGFLVVPGMIFAMACMPGMMCVKIGIPNKMCAMAVFIREQRRCVVIGTFGTFG